MDQEIIEKLLLLLEAGQVEVLGAEHIGQLQRSTVGSQKMPLVFGRKKFGWSMTLMLR
jgi:hypothetical protein